MAAVRYAEQLGSESMFGASSRRALLREIVDPAVLPQQQPAMDSAYAQLGARLGLDSEGQPAAGTVFVSKAQSAGATVQSYRDEEAVVAVVCSGVLSRTGTDPVAQTGWFTITLRMGWVIGSDGALGWRIREHTQTDGPTPQAVPPASQ